MIEKRRSCRYDLQLEMRFRVGVADFGPWPYAGLTVNISSNGILFKSGMLPEEAAVGVAIDAVIKWPAARAGLPQQLRILGHVVRLAPGERCAMTLERWEFQARSGVWEQEVKG